MQIFANHAFDFYVFDELAERGGFQKKTNVGRKTLSYANLCRFFYCFGQGDESPTSVSLLFPDLISLKWFSFCSICLTSPFHFKETNKITR